MKTIKQAIIKRLRQELISDRTLAHSVFALRAPQNQRPPYAVFQLIVGDYVHGFGSDSALTRSRWQFEVYAETDAKMDEARSALMKALSRWLQEGPPKVQGALIENVGPDFWLDDVSLARGVFEIAIDYEEVV